jgi:hypothetical protein
MLGLCSVGGGLDPRSLQLRSRGRKKQIRGWTYACFEQPSGQETSRKYARMCVEVWTLECEGREAEKKQQRRCELSVLHMFLELHFEFWGESSLHQAMEGALGCVGVHVGVWGARERTRRREVRRRGPARHRARVDALA